MGIPVFFLLMQCKSGSLYFLHKLLNETAYLRSMKSPGVGITAFFVCPTVGTVKEYLGWCRYHLLTFVVWFAKRSFSPF